MSTPGVKPVLAPNATDGSTDQPEKDEREPKRQTRAGRGSGGARSPQTNDASTDTSDSPETTSSSQKGSRNSGKRTSSSSKSWRQPADAKELAAQTNMVATMLLNNEIDIDTARTYAALTRVIAQVLSVTVTRARFVKTEPDLSLAWGAEEDES